MEIIQKKIIVKIGLIVVKLRVKMRPTTPPIWKKYNIICKINKITKQKTQENTTIYINFDN